MECCNTLKSFVELSDFFGSNTSILGEQVKGLWIIIESFKVHQILINGIESLLLRSWSEKNTSISSFNSVLGNWWLVIWSWIDNWDSTNTETWEQWWINFLSWLRSTCSREINWFMNRFWDRFWNWLWFRSDFFNNIFDFLISTGSLFSRVLLLSFTSEWSLLKLNCYNIDNSTNLPVEQ